MHLKSARGDTLIEVLVAVTVLSLVVTLCYTVMTRSFSYGQVALERNITQNMLNGQISVLRDIYARAHTGGSAADWTEVSARVIDDNGLTAGGNPLGSGPQRTTVLNSANTACQRNQGAFYFGTNATGTIETAPSALPTIVPPATPVRTATYPIYGDGMWIEGYKLVDNNSVYYDFYVKACWEAAIGGQLQSILTTVRFHEIQ